MVTMETTKYEKLVTDLTGRGVRDPKALAAWIGRKKLGKKKFQAKAAAGRKAKMDAIARMAGK